MGILYRKGGGAVNIMEINNSASVRPQALAWRGHEPPEAVAGFKVRNLAAERGAMQAAPPPEKCGSQGGSGVRPPPIPVPRGGSAARSACPNPPKNGSFSFVADPEAPFVPILPQDVAAYLPAAKIFRSLGSKTDPILHIQFTRLWGIVARNRGAKKWRRERDSNPRPACAGSGFQDRRVKPLRHLSTGTAEDSSASAGKLPSGEIRLPRGSRRTIGVFGRDSMSWGV